MEFLNLLVHKIYIIIVDSLQTILLVASVILIFYVFLIRPHEVTGFSMFPTYDNKEMLLTFLPDKNIKKLHHGDVIVFYSPVEPEKLYIKRVIGMPGDTVMVQDGQVSLNGAPLSEPYLRSTVATYGGAFLPNGQTATVDPGTLFMMGDNRENSSDSREWGFLKEDRIVGRSVARIFPPQHFNLIKNPYAESK